MAQWPEDHMKESVRGKSESRVAERMHKVASPKEGARGESERSVAERIR
jgi:hypothetical protein